MKTLDTLNFIGQDTRTRRFLLPSRIVHTTGNVQGAENLLIKKDLQIGLDEPAATLTTLKNGPDGPRASIILDFGKEINGTARILGADTALGTQANIRLVFGESVAEAMSDIGTKNATNDHTMRDFTATIPFLSDQEFAQTGFRFLRVELMGQDTQADIKSILAVFIYRDLEYLGSFKCSDQRLNDIYNTAAYTCHLNMQTMLWDGIKRDRLVWIGDMHPEMLTIRSVFGRQPIVEESMDFVMNQTPLPGWMNGLPTYSMWWVLIAWDWYWYTGDVSFLTDRQKYMAPLLRQLAGLVGKDGQDSIPEYFLDWPTRGTDSAISGSRSLLRLALAKGVQIAVLYGDDALKDTCLRAVIYMSRHIENHGGSKQSAAFLAKSYPDLREEIVKDVLLKDGPKGLSTFLSYYVLTTIADGGHKGEAIQQMREYYGAMLDVGATTFWEDFNMDWVQKPGRIDEPVLPGGYDIHGGNGGFCYTGYRHSLCHGWASGPVTFLAEQVLGVRILEPGCRKISVKPYLGGLDWAEGAFPTPYGVVTLRHEKGLGDRAVTTVNGPGEVTVVYES
ncbi:MAG: alpha-L-rhamnosidase [Defluviitaleaceae bacterium]|nr:alpha-L-rhamnosidase [Defluviitaleaceae bacterium]